MNFYKKKNTESNLSNQIFSFIACNKSYEVMIRVFNGNEKKVEDFYKLLKRIKKGNKKYVNRTFIAELLKLK